MQIELCTGVIFHMSDKIHVAVKELNVSTFKENANHFRCFKFSLYMYILQARTQKGQSAPSHQLENFQNLWGFFVSSCPKLDKS